MSIETTDEALAYLENLSGIWSPGDASVAALLVTRALRQRDKEAKHHAEEIRRLTAEVEEERAYGRLQKGLREKAEAEAAALRAERDRLREALEQIDRETKCASDATLLRMGSIARAGLTAVSQTTTAWLIEAPAGAWGWERVHWWCGQREETAHWTDDASIAVRFMRQGDAQAALDALSDWGFGQSAKVTEHVFIGEIG